MCVRLLHDQLPLELCSFLFPTFLTLEVHAMFSDEQVLGREEVGGWRAQWEPSRVKLCRGVLSFHSAVVDFCHSIPLVCFFVFSSMFCICKSWWSDISLKTIKLTKWAYFIIWSKDEPVTQLINHSHFNFIGNSYHFLERK